MTLQAVDRRQCRSYERVWHDRFVGVDRFVDENLEDAWLELLNSLGIFDLVSICEGHTIGSEAQGGSRAHVNLRLKKSLLSVAARDFDDHAETIRTQLRELFGDGRSDVEVEFRVRLRPTAKTTIRRRDLVIRIKALHERTRQSLDEET